MAPPDPAGRRDIVQPAIFTIGYEGLLQGQLIELLRAARVRVLLDIRAVAVSRKAGFSKSLLAASSAAAGIIYRHDRRLGTPKPGRIAARAHRTAELRAVFADHMTTATAQAALADAVGQTASAATCLLCFERDPHDCHRSIVADLIRSRTGQVIRHL